MLKCQEFASYYLAIHVQYLLFSMISQYLLFVRQGTIIFSQSLNRELTADVTAGPWKGRKMNIGSDKEVSVFQGHSRERDLFEGLPENFP